MSPPVNIATAIAAEISAQNWGVSMTVEMSHADWELELTAADGLRCDVVPTGMQEFDQESQGAWDNTIKVHVVLRKQLNEEDDEIDPDTGRTKTADINALINVLYSMVEHFAPKQPAQPGRSLNALPGAAWREVKILTIRDKKLLRVCGMYVGVFELTYTLVT